MAAHKLIQDRDIYSHKQLQILMKTMTMTLHRAENKIHHTDLSTSRTSEKLTPTPSSCVMYIASHGFAKVQNCESDIS